MRLDDFTDISAWLPVASGLAELRISSEPGPSGNVMRLDFDFHGGGGFVVARRAIALTVPETYDFCFAIRGHGAPNKLEIKFADPSGRNVWWYHEDAFELSAEWRPMRIRSRQIEFAWGPAGGGAMSEVGAIELVIAAGPGGKGSVWIGDLGIEDRTPRVAPIVRASSALPGHAAENVLDRSVATSWRSAGAGSEWLLIDFQAEREYGGLVIDWERSGGARAFTVETSNDGVAWRTVHAATQAESDKSYIYMPATDARYLRLALDESVSGQGFGIIAIDVKPYGFSRSIQDFFHAVAADAPRGTYPKYFCREQTYWTPVGVADGETCALMNEEGMVEVDRGTFSIEPFLLTENGLVTWADAETAQELERGYLPMPSSVWRVPALVFRTTAFAVWGADRPILYIRYRVENAGAAARRVTLFATCRPFQVNPPWQSFGALGGVSPIKEIAFDANVVWVNGERAVVPLTEPDGFGAAAFEQGAVTEHLRAGELPDRGAVNDAFGYASGALRFDLDLAPSSSRDVYLAIPFGVTEGGPRPVATLIPDVAGAEQFAEAVRQWESKLDKVEIDLPAAARDYANTWKTATAHILINRDGPALQPGPRRYTRSWVRDGAIMAGALLRMGCVEEALEYVRWYAPYQAPDGAVPCCVDRSGPDWLVEHDSHGELVFAVWDCFRFTGDGAFLEEMWPVVAKAVAYIEALRETRLTPEYETEEKLARRGLLPESASHEGYLAHPVHAYWDDFWALRALADAAAMADVLGKPAEARHLTELAHSFRESLYTSLYRTIAERKIEYLPGSVEWADFDPTATSNAISLLGELRDLPPGPLQRTYDLYLEGFRKRRRNEIDWANYTAYEVRIVGALVHLGRRADAAELADFLIGDRRPLAWNQWPEISWRDPKSPGHIGDVPHTWIGAEYVLALRSMLVYEREADQALVVAAGIPAAWLDDGGEVAVRDLPTPYGTLSFSLRHAGPGALAVSLFGDLEMPPGNVVLRPPLPGPLVRAEVNGAAAATFDAESLTLGQWPAEVVMRY